MGIQNPKLEGGKVDCMFHEKGLKMVDPKNPSAYIISDKNIINIEDMR